MAVTRTGPPDSSSGRITVPKLNRDPVQSLRPFSLDITVAGHDFTIPALPASEWLSILMVPDMDLSDILPGLLSIEEAESLEELILARELDLEELEDTVLAILETVSARDWWVVLKLVENARVSWDVLGAELGLRGVNATQVSLSSWLDMLLLVLLRAMDPKEVQMFTLKLEAPPPEVRGEESELEMSSSAFMAMAQ